MNRQDRIRPYPWQRRRRAMLLVMAVFLVFLGAWAVFRIRTAGRIEEKLHALETLAAEMAPVEENADPAGDLPVSAPQNNAADLYIRALDQWDDEAADKVFDVLRELNRWPDSKRLSPELRQKLLEFLQLNAMKMQLLHEAATYEFCNYPLYQHEQRKPAPPYLRHMRSGVRLLCIEARLASDDEDAATALDALLAAFALAESTRGSDPFQVLRPASHYIVREFVRKILCAQVLQEDQLNLLQEKYADATYSDILNECIAENTREGLLAFDDPAAHIRQLLFFQYIFSGKEPFAANLWIPHGLNTLVWGAGVSGWTDLDREVFLTYAKPIMEIYDRPYYECVDKLQAIMKNVSEHNGFLRIAPSLLETMVFSRNLHARHEAVLRTTQTALAIERYRLACNHLPLDLEELTGVFLDTVPIDPFDGKPLRYVVLDDGYSVYSIGSDLEDDNGAPSKEPRPEGDIVFEVRREAS